MRDTIYDWRYPCKDCNRKRCTFGCSRWREWVGIVWREVCAPFKGLGGSGNG